MTQFTRTIRHTKHDLVKRYQNSADSIDSTDSVVVTFSEGRQHRGPLANKFSGHTGAVCGLKVCAIKLFLKTLELAYSGQTQKSNVTSGFRFLEACKSLKRDTLVRKRYKQGAKKTNFRACPSGKL